MHLVGRVELWTVNGTGQNRRVGPGRHVRHQAQPMRSYCGTARWWAAAPASAGGRQFTGHHNARSRAASAAASTALSQVARRWRCSRIVGLLLYWRPRASNLGHHCRRHRRCWWCCWCRCCWCIRQWRGTRWCHSQASKSAGDATTATTNTRARAEIQVTLKWTKSLYLVLLIILLLLWRTIVIVPQMHRHKQIYSILKKLYVINAFHISLAQELGPQQTQFKQQVRSTFDFPLITAPFSSKVELI